jgi:hypothetical protein
LAVALFTAEPSINRHALLVAALSYLSTVSGTPVVADGGTTVLCCVVFTIFMENCLNAVQ